jgi:hypothetical protein
MEIGGGVERVELRRMRHRKWVDDHDVSRPGALVRRP